MNIKNIILDILFPKICVGCGKEGNYICSKCDLFISESILICPICGNSSPSGETHSNCLSKYSLDGLIGAWDYDGIMKKLIYTIKNNGITDIINVLVERLVYLMLEDRDRFCSFLSLLSSKDTYITYIPMNKKEKRIKGFNSSEIIATKVGKLFNCNVVSLFDKIIDTRKQSVLDIEERFENVKGSFVLNTDDVRMNKVVIVDDYFTTVSTLNECSYLLKKANVKTVWGFSLANELNMV